MEISDTAASERIAAAVWGIEKIAGWRDTENAGSAIARTGTRQGSGKKRIYRFTPAGRVFADCIRADSDTGAGDNESMGRKTCKQDIHTKTHNQTI